MLKLSLTKPPDSAYKVLCLGAHADDIEIGCGRTILKLAAAHPAAEFHWVVFSASPERANEAQQSFERFLGKTRLRKIRISNFRESFFPYSGAPIKNDFEKLNVAFSPDLIFTHHRNDRHQDHRLVSDLTWNTFRDHLILEYEIPKYDGDLGSPNLFVELDQATVRRKINYILAGFRSQKSKQWFDKETFLSALRLRGIECNARSKYAEAFHCRKILLA